MLRGLYPTRPAPARHAIVVGSGKGGVGKSTTSVNLAVSLAQAGHRVGLLDADLHGPNVALMIGLKREAWTQEWTLAESRARQRTLAAVDRYGVRFMSAGFILGDDQPMALDATTVGMLLGQLLFSTEWGQLDHLVIDLPPGTGDVVQQLAQLVKLTGAVIVVGPQDVSHLDGRKAVSMFKQLRVRVLGAVENMGTATCPHCGEPFALFPDVPPDRSVWSMGVEKLGAVPLDPAIATATDRGMPVVVRQPDLPVSRAYRRIADELHSRLSD